MKNLVKIRKITNNNKLYGVYTYQVRLGTATLFANMRKWAWETWGSSCEYQLYRELSRMVFDPITGHRMPNLSPDDSFNDLWCWQVESDEYKFCLYLKGEEEVMILKLRFGLT